MSAYVSFECPKHGWQNVDISSAACPACEIGYVVKERLRAQVAVLEEMAKAVCYGCRHDEPTVEIMGSAYHLSGHTESPVSCDSWPINKRIAALRKELE